MSSAGRRGSPALLNGAATITMEDEVEEFRYPAREFPPASLGMARPPDAMSEGMAAATAEKAAEGMRAVERLVAVHAAESEMATRFLAVAGRRRERLVQMMDAAPEGGGADGWVGALRCQLAVEGAQAQGLVAGLVAVERDERLRPSEDDAERWRRAAAAGPPAARSRCRARCGSGRRRGPRP